MQRIGTVRWRRVVYYILPIILMALFVALDRVSKIYFENLYKEQGTTEVIEGFFRFTFLINKGAAWGFLSKVSWGMTFFIIITSVAIIGFIVIYVFSVIKKRTWLTYAMTLVIAGTIGNYIDRVFFGGVTDFLSFTFWGYYFPVFNLADSFLVVGVVMVCIYVLFLDKNAVFKKTKNQEVSVKEDEDGNQNV